MCKSESVVGAAALLLATSVWAAPTSANTSYEYAQVIASRPIYQTVEISTPRQECWNEQVVSHRRSHSESRTPAIVGTIIGGALGNAVGHGKSNKRVGTVVGAVLGHSIGRDIVTANGRNRETHYETVRHCETVYEYREEDRLIGYDVRYRYNNEEYSVRMDEEPGDRVRVRVNVQPVF
ncbi:MAG: glycine zipper 2TM domain-containing protein [Gammaproteobacteria bacterium]|nr:glycine zipper 2TM domain-containing protein [Gammaproteobacteria bacterium]